MDFVIHDLKTERPNISGGLPNSYRLVPVAFYLSAVLGVGLSIFFFLSERAYRTSEKDWNQQAAASEAIKSGIVAKQTKISREAAEANQLADWLEGARPVQPIGVTIARSMVGNATIDELNVERNPQIPAHLFMTLKINGGGSQQIESTLDALGGLNYQPYSAQQIKGQNNAVDFKATLIWRNPQ